MKVQGKKEEVKRRYSVVAAGKRLRLLGHGLLFLSVRSRPPLHICFAGSVEKSTSVVCCLVVGLCCSSSFSRYVDERMRTIQLIVGLPVIYAVLVVIGWWPLARFESVLDAFRTDIFIPQKQNVVAEAFMTTVLISGTLSHHHQTNC